MSATVTLLGGAALGMSAGLVLVPLTRRELAAAVARSDSSAGERTGGSSDWTVPPITGAQVLGLAVVSGLLLAYVLYRVGWYFNALPPLLLLIGLIQLAYCDLKRRLLPKTLVYALSFAVITSGVVIAACTGESDRLLMATLGGIASFVLFFAVNLMNPRWMAFGDVRLSLVFGFGLAWVSPIDLFEAFFYANLLALVVGLALLALRRADRKSAMPFGVFMALGAALVLIT
jgi:leader peptidase (prepilin peptidase)/N-methyltransferase